MFDITTFGSATRDNFLKLKKESHQIIKSGKFLTGEGLCFSLGSKIEIDDMVISTGGGGANTAVTFALQGFKVAYVGKIGDDKRGEAIMEDLEKFGVNTRFIIKDKVIPSAYSVILSSGVSQTSILVYRGACHFLKKNDIPINKLKSRWFYLAPLKGKLLDSFGFLVNYAKKNNIKIMANIGKDQIGLDKRKLKLILSKIDILSLNQEEASLLTGVPFQQEKALFKKLDKIIKGIAIMTKGKKGVVVSDGKYMWSAPSFSVPVQDATGAGDAFSSGFLSGLIKTDNVSFAIKLGLANSISCIGEIGAKNGLLKGIKSPYLKKIRVKKIKLWS
ncbi:MAG: carbohydrate kinase family protein [Patescibacteria group bacterium]|nr:carbohydrate kinase family protein [Patescibacteria group bacterium]MBU1877083.1 carbohydrate kinase family protein [Patescibacteria group bacterium]